MAELLIRLTGAKTMTATREFPQLCARKCHASDTFGRDVWLAGSCTINVRGLTLELAVHRSDQMFLLALALGLVNARSESNATAEWQSAFTAAQASGDMEATIGRLDWHRGPRGALHARWSRDAPAVLPQYTAHGRRGRGGQPQRADRLRRTRRSSRTSSQPNAPGSTERSGAARSRQDGRVP